jgi:membrane protein
LNVAYEVQETRGIVRVNLISLAFTLSGVIILIAALSAAIVLPWVLDHVFFGWAEVATIIRWLRAPIGIAGALLALAVVYRFGPARKKPKWRWVSPGSLFAAAFLILASAGFAYYTAHFASYNKTYGALGAVIGFMTWLWISSIVVMVGAEINAEVEREAKEGEPAADRVLGADKTVAAG